MPDTKIPGYIFDLCRKLRQKQTKVEKLLWECLRRKRLNALKFRRQHPLGRFIADFYCPEARLVIELDGKVHHLKDQREYDKMRKQIIEVHRIRILRIKNEEIERNIENVLRRIADLTFPPQSPLHKMEKGSPCPSVLRPQGRRKGIPLDPEIFGIEGHPEGETGGKVGGLFDQNGS